MNNALNFTRSCENYRYARQGKRVLKSSQRATNVTTHVCLVRYLSGLEHCIFTADPQRSEIHQVVTVNGVRILCWQQGRSDGSARTSVRYTAGDRSNSAMLELDGGGNAVSREVYYPYGGTAQWAGRDRTEIRSKTFRYGGKERDATGLIYYGFRYYAPWLMRWLNPDPARAVDGVNILIMLKNNPLTFRDRDGRMAYPKDETNVRTTAGNYQLLKQKLQNKEYYVIPDTRNFLDKDLISSSREKYVENFLRHPEEFDNENRYVMESFSNDREKLLDNDFFNAKFKPS